MNKSEFPDELKLAEVIMTFRKDYLTKSKRYRPASVLPTVLKVSKKIMHRQMSIFVEKFLSPFMCGCSKGFATHQVLFQLT